MIPVNCSNLRKYKSISKSNNTDKVRNGVKEFVTVHAQLHSSLSVLLHSRVFTALCRLKEDLGCVRVVCYDVMRSLHRLQNTALELVVAMVTVWPEILRSSPSYISDEQLCLARTLLVVLLNWADSFSSALGNILRTLYSLGSDPVTVETVKDLGLGIMKRLQDESFSNVCIAEGKASQGTLVIT